MVKNNNLKSSSFLTFNNILLHNNDLDFRKVSAQLRYLLTRTIIKNWYLQAYKGRWQNVNMRRKIGLNLEWRGKVSERIIAEGGSRFKTLSCRSSGAPATRRSNCIQTKCIPICIQTFFSKFLVFQILWMLQCFKLQLSDAKFHPPNSKLLSFHATVPSVLATPFPPSTGLKSPRLPPQLLRGPSMAVRFRQFPFLLH